MTKVRQASEGAKPSYEAIEKRLKEQQEKLNVTRDYVRGLEHQAEELRAEVRALRTTIETMSETIADRVRQRRWDKAEPIPF